VIACEWIGIDDLNTRDAPEEVGHKGAADWSLEQV